MGSAFLVTGIVFIISAVIIAMHTLGSIRWVTQDLDDDAVAFIKRVIFRRDAQRRRLMLAISLLVLGLTSYMTAVSIAALASRTWPCTTRRQSSYEACALAR